MPRFCNLLILVAAMVGWAQAQILSSALAVNSANYDSTALAQGSIFVLFGSSMGPDKLVYASVFPLPTTLAGTSVTVTSGSMTLNCPMVYSSSGQVAAILPSETPVGSATIKLANTAFSYDVSFPSIEVVASSPGIFTLNSRGEGPGVFDALSGSVTSFTNSAKAGDTVTLWATGLGPINGNDAQAPEAHNIPGIEVYVGSLSAKVLYAGRSPCCAGLDQISFEIPRVIDSCYMPVAVRGGGIVSNFVTLAVHNKGGMCSDTGPAFPWSIVARVLNGEQLKGGVLMFGPMGVLSPVGFNLAQFVAHKLSRALHATVSEDDADQLIHALQYKKQGAIRSFVRKYRKQWDALSSQQKALLRDQANLTQVGALAVFGNFAGLGGLLPVLGGSYLPPLGTCTVVRMYPNSRASRSNPLDAGSSLTLTGPTGQTSLTKSSKGNYQALLGPTFLGPDVPAGQYTISGQGGSDIVPFSTALNITRPIVWSNKAAIQAIDRSQPLTLSWSGGEVAGHVLIGGYQSGHVGAAFFCTEDTARGTFTIPALVLSALQVSSTGVVLFIGHHPLDGQVSIPGLDLAYLVDASSDSRTVPLR